MNSMIVPCDCISEIFSIIGALAAVVSVFVAIIIAKRIPEKDILSHRQHIRAIVKDLCFEMEHNKRNHMLRILDVDRFDKYYPEIFNNHRVQSYLKGELDGTDIKGINIIDGLIGLSRCSKNPDIFKVDNNNPEFTAIRVGLIPYSCIIDIDADGDDCEPSAIIYCKFKKHYPVAFRRFYLQPDNQSDLRLRYGFVKRRSPYQSYKYYIVEDRINNKKYNDIESRLRDVQVKGDSPVYP